MVPQHLRQSHTPDQLHSDKGLAAIEVDLVNRNDVGMIQAACGSGFAEEALTAGWIRRARIMEKLQRNRPIPGSGRLFRSRWMMPLSWGPTLDARPSVGPSTNSITSARTLPDSSRPYSAAMLG